MLALNNLIAVLALGALPTSEPASEPEELDIFSILAEEREVGNRVSIASRSNTQTIAEAPSIVSVLTRTQLLLLGVRNIAEALQYIPGLTAQYTKLGKYRTVLRGQRNAPDTLVLINGHSITNLYDGSVDYEMGIDNIDRIEVIRGPGSTLYGANAFAGVINIVTVQHYAQHTGRLHGALFPGPPVSTHHTDTNGDFDASVMTSFDLPRLTTLTLFGSLRYDRGASMNMPFDGTSGTFTDGRQRLLADQLLGGTVEIGFSKTGVFAQNDSFEFRPILNLASQGPNYGPLDAYAPGSSLFRMLLLLPLKYRFEINQLATFTLTGAANWQEQNESVQITRAPFSNFANPIAEPDGLRYQRTLSVTRFNLNPNFDIHVPRVKYLWSKHDIAVGVQGIFGNVPRYLYGQNFGRSNNVLQSFRNFSDALRTQLEGSGIAVDGFQNYDAFELSQRGAWHLDVAAYVESQLQIEENPVLKAWLTLGLGLNEIADTRAGNAPVAFTTVNPRLSLVIAPTFWNALRGVTGKFLVGTAFRPPTFEELYDQTTDTRPNSNIKPQTALAIEVGVELTPVRMIRNWAQPETPGRLDELIALRANFFWTTTEQNINVNPLVLQYTNIGSSKVLGQEVELAVQYSAQDFLFVNYSHVSSSYVPGSCDVTLPECAFLGVITNPRRLDFPGDRLNVGLSFRPIGMIAEALGRTSGASFRYVSGLSLSYSLHFVGPSQSNQGAESNLRPFQSDGYTTMTLGLGYAFAWERQTLKLQLFARNLLDADVSEPLPTLGITRPMLPRPGRSFFAQVEASF